MSKTIHKKEPIEPRARKGWFDRQTQKIKRVILICTLIGSIGVAWGALEALGIHIFQIVISIGDVPTINGRVTNLERKSDKDSIMRFWQRQHNSDTTRMIFNRLDEILDR